MESRWFGRISRGGAMQPVKVSPTRERIHDRGEVCIWKDSIPFGEGKGEEPAGGIRLDEGEDSTSGKGRGASMLARGLHAYLARSFDPRKRRGPRSALRPLTLVPASNLVRWHLWEAHVYECAVLQKCHKDRADSDLASTEPGDILGSGRGNH